MYRGLNYLMLIGFLFSFFTCEAAKSPKVEYSKAGFFTATNGVRKVSSFNVGWRFNKGEAVDAHKVEFDDSKWSLVNCPHGLEYLPDNAGGNLNYQGVAWYRKRFTLDESYKNKVNKLHFEAVMGKCIVWVNGQVAFKHFGGFLPFSVDINKYIKLGEQNVIAVMADNSDDPTYPPGKPQGQLDFSYFGGIYRDIWLVSTNKVHITNPNDVNKVAGGGILSNVELLSNKKAKISLKIDVKNANSAKKKGYVEVILKDKKNRVITGKKSPYSIGAKQSGDVSTELVVENAELWTPWNPTLYTVEVYVKDHSGAIIDGVAIKQGLRKIEFRGEDGFWLNNERYPNKLIGSNRHQMFATVGNALPNSGQYKDAIILKNAGHDVVRTGHYPPDPAFMDACDALGIFCIIATPGWQFWNDDEIFYNRIYSDVANMVRRDRNRTCMLMYEPILNETHYPKWFAKRTYEIVHEEYPFQGVFAVCDNHLAGKDFYDVLYAHPYDKMYGESKGQSFFTREWGDNVDGWGTQNSTSRIKREWGEQAQIIQTMHFGDPSYDFSSLEKFAHEPNQYVGGTMWHSSDHNRGYFTTPFYGGMMDMFRLPKYSYYMFASQRQVSQGYAPMVYIAHEMSPASGADVKVFTNCEEVRFIKYKKDTLTCKISELNKKMASPIVTFKDVFHFQELKEYTRVNNFEQVDFVAEGLIDGKVVARYVKVPSYKPSQVILKVVDEGIDLVADGSDLIKLVAYVTDHNGTVKRLDDHYIEFQVYGEGQQIAPNLVSNNPRKTEWGTAPVLVRSTLKAGEITVKASVINKAEGTLLPAQITFSSVPCQDDLIYDEIGQEPKGLKNIEVDLKTEDLKLKIHKLQQKIRDYEIKEVGKQQQEMEQILK